MKKKLIAGISIMVVAGILGFGIGHAQGVGQTSFGTFPGPLSGCPTPLAGTDYVCDVAGVGYETSLSGAAYSPIGGSSLAVSSVFARTGAVVALTGDYSFKSIGGTISASQLPATLTCSQVASIPAPSTVQINTTGVVQTGTVVLSGCK